MNNYPLSRQEDIVIQDLDSELLIYDLRRNKALHLNETSAIIWRACDGKRTISELGARLGKELNKPAADEFVWLVLDQLRKENLLANGDEIAPVYNGMSRREVVKKIGLSSMIALPVITSLVAPSPLHAASTTACGQQCQCSGLLAPVTVCPPGFADCPQGCNCNISPNGCFSGESGVIACNGICGGPVGPTCPPSSPGDCTCFGSFSINQTCPGTQCPGGCTACRVTQACVMQEVGPPACNGVCQ